MELDVITVGIIKMLGLSAGVSGMHASYENSSKHCAFYTTDCSDGEIRLVGGTRLNEGRVEICMDKTWGTVCGDFLDSNDASAICVQLEYSEFGLLKIKFNLLCSGCCFILYKDPVIERDSVYGSGSGLVFDVDCSRESCSFVPVNCSHSSDVGVVCKGITDVQIVLFARAWSDQSSFLLCSVY